jgi:hypothetical protein
MAADAAPKAVREMAEDALERLGGVAWLQDQAKRNPRAFLALVGRVMPLQLRSRPGDPPTVEVVQF